MESNGTARVAVALRTQLEWLRERLFAPIDIASLVIFRIMFGAIMVWEVWRYFDNGRIERYYMEPDFHFKYYGFSWVEPWPGNGMIWHFLVMGLLGAFITVGFLYRVSTVLFFLAFTYMYLLEQSRYLNHFYLVSLLSFLMIFVPAHRARSVDAWLWPKLRSDVVPAWSLWLLRAQLGIVYVYAGIAKLNGDWLRGHPLHDWLGKRSGDPILGSLFEHTWVIMLFSYGGLLLDLFVVPALLWRRTRPYAFIAAVTFHLLNARIFSIGIFPWMMIAATLLFLPADWPRRLLPIPKGAQTPDLLPALAPTTRRYQHLIMSLLAAYLAIQVLVPLRHWLYPGSVHWTEEGHRFAWHMKLRDKDADARFFATDPTTGETWEIKQRDYLNHDQQDEMAGRPDMVLQFAHYSAERLRAEGYEQIEVRAAVMASLNGRRPQLLIDPDVDLASQPRNLWHASWIKPLTQPLRPPRKRSS